MDYSKKLNKIFKTNRLKDFLPAQKPENGDISERPALINEKPHQISIKIIMKWIMNNTELFAKGNLIKQSKFCVWWNTSRRRSAFLLRFDLLSNMQEVL